MPTDPTDRQPEPEPGGSPKRFDDVGGYEREIGQLVPGHGLMRAVAISAVQAHLAREGRALGRLLVVGVGPGSELEALVEAFPSAQIEVFETSERMARAAAAGLVGTAADRVQVHHRALEVGEAADFDVAVCLLVAHLVPVGRAREAFWQALGSALRPGGVLALSEISVMGDRERDSWLRWSRGAGVEGDRLEQLDVRLQGGFPLLDLDRTRALARGAGLEWLCTPVQILGVGLHLWRRAP